MTLVNQLPKLSSVEDQLEVKLGGVIHGGETDCPWNGCSLIETRVLPPQLSWLIGRAAVSSGWDFKKLPRHSSDVSVFVVG